jgi:hypothetical protein
LANIAVPPQQQPTKLSVFLGINEDIDGALGLRLGEASTMFDFRITPNMKLKQREGYKEILNFDAGIVNQMIVFQGKLIVAQNGFLYEFEGSEF